MEGDKFEKALCDLKCVTLKDNIKTLEIRVFETLKKITQLSDMSNDGHKEALKSAIISIQKDFEFGSKEFNGIKKDIEKIEQKLTDSDKVNSVIKEDNIAIKKDLKIEIKKVKFLTKFIYGLSALLVLYIITGEDLSKLLSFIIKLTIV